MKLLIASDIHGSAAWCRKLTEAFLASGAEKLVLLGDILYHGPRNDLPDGYAPKEVIALLNPLADQILAVRGNCEAEVDQMVLDFPVLSDSMILYTGKRMIFATHGHIFSESQPPKLHSGDILLCGHTHVAKAAEHDSYLYLNPGSVSIPKENTRHGYMLLTDHHISRMRFDGSCDFTIEL